MEHLEDEKLQRYFDDELTEGESKVVRRDVAASAMEQARLGQLERLGGLLRDHAEATSEELDADALFAGISKGIAEEPNPRLRVIEGARQKRRTGYALGAVVAIAAAVALVLLLRPPPEETDPGVAETHPFDTRHEVLVENTTEIQVHAPAGSEVENVDFGGNIGTVFQVPGEQGQPLAVVWIDESLGGEP